ncbi:MAG: transglycosylase domain-containing protein [Candidatus Obscuribacterales bacterium]|nr:transglycosylase domain-containing protein [Candidatus Obscuribacterales bacterium]
MKTPNILGILLFIAIGIGIVSVPIARSILKVPEPHLERLANHSYVPLSRISKNMQLAILAVEDHRFYDHGGIDLLGLIRATIDNTRAKRMVEGASTISQQLAKIAFLDQDEKTAQRKLSQLILSADLEQKYSKDEILESYLNSIYFGRGAYGIEEASEKYFGVKASKLSIAQAAFLAGIVRAPSVLGDPGNKNVAAARQNQVIDNMVQYGYISIHQAHEAIGKCIK